MKLSEIQFGVLARARSTDRAGRVCGLGVNSHGEYLAEILTRDGVSIWVHPANLVPVEDEPADNGINLAKMRDLRRDLLSERRLGPAARKRIASIITKAIEEAEKES